MARFRKRFSLKQRSTILRIVSSVLRERRAASIGSCPAPADGVCNQWAVAHDKATLRNGMDRHVDDASKAIATSELAVHRT